MRDSLDGFMDALGDLLRGPQGPALMRLMFPLARLLVNHRAAEGCDAVACWGARLVTTMAEYWQEAGWPDCRDIRSSDLTALVHAAAVTAEQHDDAWQHRLHELAKRRSD